MKQMLFFITLFYLIQPGIAHGYIYQPGSWCGVESDAGEQYVHLCSRDAFWNYGNAGHDYCNGWMDEDHGCILDEDDEYVYICEPDSADSCDMCGLGDYSYLDGQLWESLSTGIVVKQTFDGWIMTDNSALICHAQINSDIYETYACAANYYQTGGSGENIQCSPCPESCGCNGTCTRGFNSDGANSITSCTIPAGAGFSESIGCGDFTADCSWSN